MSSRVREFALQPQRRDQRAEVRIATALAKPVQRALDLPGACANGGERIRNCLFSVVMSVDADVIAGDMLHDLGNDSFDLIRHGAAIGIAQHHPTRAGIVSRPSASQREFRIFLVAVEKVLAIEHDLAPSRLCRLHAIAYRSEVFFLCRLERYAHLIGR
jgi:hypothetical protein